MSLKAKLEAIIYAAEEPVTIEQMLPLVKDELLASRPQPEASPGAGSQEELLAGAGEDFTHAGQETAAERAADASVDATEAPAAAAAEPGKVDSGKAISEKDSGKKEKAEKKALLEALRGEVEELAREYANSDRGMEIRSVAGGYRMSTKPEHHDVVRAFAKNLKPPLRLSLPALETLAVIAYKQPATAPEISEIRGVDSSGVLAGLLDRKLITTAGRKQVIGRPILYKTTKDFLSRFGLKDLAELPSMEEFEKMTSGQADLFSDVRDAALADATGVPDERTEEQPEEEEEKEADGRELSADAAANEAPGAWETDSETDAPQPSGHDVEAEQPEPEEAETKLPTTGTG